MAVPLVLIQLLLSAASAVATQDPLVVGQTFMAGSNDPTAGSTGWALTSHGIAEKLFTVNSAGVVVGQVAQSVNKVSTLSWVVNLKAGYQFSDGTSVTATHVADALRQLNQVNSGAQASLGTMTMTPLNDLALKIDSERATPVMDAVLAEWPFVVYLVKNGERFFTGPYAIETFVAGERIDLIPNPYYPRASERSPLVIRKHSSGQSVATALEGGHLDLGFHLPVDSLPTFRAMDNVTVKSFLVGYQYMMWYNMRYSQLSDVRVRKALDMALDREELTQAVNAGRATRSFFPENTPYYLADTQLNADKSGAETLLDQAGWLLNGNGIREMAGVPLTLNLVAYPQRPSLVTIAPVIQQRLAALGIVVTTTITSGSSWNELYQILADKSFHLLLWAQHTLPAGDPQFFMNAFFRTGAGNNHAGLASSVVDGLIDELSNAETATSRVSAAAAAHTGIREQAPVSMLMTPSWHVGLGSRLTSYQPWGSDYYVIHADFGLTPLEEPNTPTTDSDEGINASGAHQVTPLGIAVAALFLLASTV
jgi:peptide/nickel transport system substrate-binding protein